MVSRDPAAVSDLPEDFLKRSGSCVRGMCTAAIDRARVPATNGIGHTMGIGTSAEYVGNAEIVDVLRNIGVDCAQGCFIDMAAPLGEPVAALTQE